LKKDFVLPILVLSAICLVVSGALAFGNAVTAPLIEKAAEERAQEAMRGVLPLADAFIPQEAEGLPDSATEVYRAANGAGFIFTVTPRGYGGEITLLCGIDPEGKIVGTAVLEHTETQGLGTVVFERKSPEYVGKTEDGIDGIDAVSGATITSNAYKAGIRDAFAAFNKMKEVAP